MRNHNSYMYWNTLINPLLTSAARGFLSLCLDKCIKRFYINLLPG